MKNKIIMYGIRVLVAIITILVLLLPQYFFYYAYRTIDYVIIMLIRILFIVFDYCLYQRLCQGYHLLNFIDIIIVIPLSLGCLNLLCHKRIILDDKQYWLVLIWILVELLWVVERYMIVKRTIL